MTMFPSRYNKPRLIGIVSAAENGWAAVCVGGGAPTSVYRCTSGASPHSAPICPGNGATAGSNSLFNNNGNSGSRLINPGDVSQGL